MFAMAMNSITLFFQGKLFAQPGLVFRQIAIGVVVTALVLIIAAKAGVPLLLAAALAGLIGGGLQPYLFKDLKYK